MKIFVINLERDKEKLAFVRRQMDALGLAFDREPAVDGRSLSEDARREAVNGFAWWCAVGRPIQPAEIGCALSHYSIYERIAESVCILEDDVELSPEFLEVLERVARFIDPAKPQVVMLSDEWGCRAAKGKAEGVVASSDAWCTDGYVITPLAAQAIRKANLPIEVPCDTWRRWVRRGLIELYHAFPTTVSQRQDLFGSSTDPCFARAKRSRSLPARVLHKCVRAFGLAVDELRWRLVKCRSGCPLREGLR